MIGCEDASPQIFRLLHAHEIILEESHAMAREAAKNGDDGTNDMIVSDIIRTNEQQVWFLLMHVADAAKSEPALARCHCAPAV